jgi:hypothetical protein
MSLTVERRRGPDGRGGAIDGRDEIIRDIAAVKGSGVAEYLRAEVEDLISDPRFLQSLPSHIQPNAIEQQRIPLLLARLREIAGL